MGAQPRHLLARWAVGAGAVAALLASPALSQPQRAGALGSPPCASATQRTFTGIYHAALIGIYQGELASPEVSDDLAHIRGATDLGAALASGDTAATVAATTRLVYHPRWHIVRLRVLSTSGQVLADVGGPYILAPVAGAITYQGNVVGSFVMSVQDDLGYEKLATRFTALPIELYSHGKPLMGRDFPTADVPARDPAEGTPLSVGGVKSIADTYNVLAYPSGTTRVLVAIPRVPASLAADSCFVVRAVVYGEISSDVARLFKLPQDTAQYVALDHEFDPQKLMFVHDGALLIASSDDQSGPPGLPRSGIVAWDGASWFVYSFAPASGLLVDILYELPPATTGQTGQTGQTGLSGST